MLIQAALNGERSRADHPAVPLSIEELTRASAHANYLDTTGDVNRAAAVNGPNYARLAAIKATYDPDNRFNINIPPIPPGVSIR